MHATMTSNAPSNTPANPSSMSNAPSCACSRTHNIVSWVAQVIAAFILAQTLFFKFTGAPESIYIFKTLGMEPLGRYGSGVGELIAVVLLLIPKPRLNVLGAAIAVGVLVGALGSHLTKLGITIPDFDDKGNQLATNDGGLLFGLAGIALAASAIVLFIHRKHLPIIGARL
mgnify:CR=1 FL=1